MNTNKTRLKRKKYRKPELIAYGSVLELTSGGSELGMEGTGKGNRNKRS